MMLDEGFGYRVGEESRAPLSIFQLMRSEHEQQNIAFVFFSKAHPSKIGIRNR